MTASRTMLRAASAASAGKKPALEKLTRSRTSSGAVWWLSPRAIRRTSEVMALRQEIPDGQEVEQDDDEAERREPCGPASAPADRPACVDGERIEEPAEKR